jgi:fatty-acyl-CoA synthase
VNERGALLTAPPTLQAALVGDLGRASGRFTFLLEEGERVHSVADLLEDAHRACGYLQEMVEPGDRVALLGPNRPEWVRWAAAIWCAGATLVPLPVPLRVFDRAAYGDRLRSLVRAAGCARTVLDPTYRELLPEDHIPWDIPLPRRLPSALPTVDPEQPAVVQFTSGSTASPKGAVLSHRAVVMGVWGVANHLGIAPGRDRLFSWLPYFHDYGLFGHLVLPLFTGTDLTVLPTERFAARPARWLSGLSRSRATWTGGPPSAWAVGLRASLRSGDSVDLSALKHARLAAEMIDPDLVDRLLESSDALRLDPAALGAGYGLAEATLSVTMTRPGDGIRLDEVGLESLTIGRAEPAGRGPTKRVVSCGRPYTGMEVRIAGPDGVVPERTVGEIQARGPALMSGYIGAPSGDPFVDGWLRTGDLGYIADGHLHVTGRIKDLIIVLGQNYAPEDVEWAACRVSGVRAGRAVAFGRPGTEGELVVAIEAQPGADPEQLKAQVTAAVLAQVGLTPREVLVLPQGSIPKTTSGKLQRSAVREAYRASGAAPIGGAGAGAS